MNPKCSILGHSCAFLFFKLNFSFKNMIMRTLRKHSDLKHINFFSILDIQKLKIKVSAELCSSRGSLCSASSLFRIIYLLTTLSFKRPLVSFVSWSLPPTSKCIIPTSGSLSNDFLFDFLDFLYFRQSFYITWTHPNNPG